MIPTRLILLPGRADEAAPFMTLDASGAVLERGRLSPDAPATASAPRTVVIVPGARVLMRRLALPAGTPAQTRAAALWSLRDDLAAPGETLRAAVGAADAEGRRWVAVVDEAAAASWSDWLRLSGVTGAVLLPDALALEAGLDGAATAVRFGDDLALRAEDLAVTVQPDLADVVAGDRPLLAVEDPGRVEGMLVRAAMHPALDLAVSARSEAGGLKRWRRAIALAGVLALSPLALILAEAIRDDAAARDADSRAAATARRISDLASAADPVAEAETRLAVLPPPGGVASAAAALFAALEAVPQAEMDSLTVDPEGGVRASLRYAAYQDLEAIRTAMEAQGLTLVDVSTVDDGGRVASDVIVGAAR
ncbi:MAG TPA: type II secretion system protein GspL [Brevundimonas sp.]|jgi:general secretion pathway protein L|uniref:type II secretion system protein GspL n=1 Tax=Brevundimonas sp. TaxID=1871086 RepID=UPI002DF12669|nr:type II secretion system protein GspL [Brevundimonas sp.]